MMLWYRLAVPLSNIFHPKEMQAVPGWITCQEEKNVWFLVGTNAKPLWVWPLLSVLKIFHNPSKNCLHNHCFLNTNNNNTMNLKTELCNKYWYNSIKPTDEIFLDVTSLKALLTSPVQKTGICKVDSICIYTDYIKVETSLKKSHLVSI